MTGDPVDLLDLSDDERSRLTAAAARDPEAQQRLVQRVRSTMGELHREDPPEARGAFDRLLAEVASSLPEDSPAHELGAGYLRGEVDRSTLLADPHVRATLTARLRPPTPGADR